MVLFFVLFFIIGYFVNEEDDFSECLVLFLFGNIVFFFLYFAIKFTDWLFNKKLYYFYRCGFLVLSLIPLIHLIYCCIAYKHIDFAIVIPMSIFAASLCSLMNKKDGTKEVKSEENKKA